MRKRRSAAYAHSVRHYMAHTTAGEAITRFLLSQLKPVQGSITRDGLSRLYIYDYSGVVGQLARRVDQEGRICFAVYPTESADAAQRLQFKRRRGRYPRAQRPIFLTAPNVWAHLNGYPNQLLLCSDYRGWKESLEQAAGVCSYASDSLLRQRYPIPFLCDPAQKIAIDDDGQEIPASAVWWFVERQIGRRLYMGRRVLMWRVWSYFLQAWEAALHAGSRSGNISEHPHAVKAADTYLAKILGAHRSAIARAIADLDKLGYLQAVLYEPSQQPNRRGIYWYYPSDGRPRKQATRNPDVTPKAVLARIREVNGFYELLREYEPD